MDAWEEVRDVELALRRWSAREAEAGSIGNSNMLYDYAVKLEKARTDGTGHENRMGSPHIQPVARVREGE